MPYSSFVTVCVQSIFDLRLPYSVCKRHPGLTLSHTHTPIFLIIHSLCGGFHHRKGPLIPLAWWSSSSFLKSPTWKEKKRDKTFGFVPLLLISFCILNFHCWHSCLGKIIGFAFFKKKNHQMFYRPSNGVFGVKLIIKDSQSFKLDFLCSSRQTTGSVFVTNRRFSLLPFFSPYNEMIKQISNLF